MRNVKSELIGVCIAAALMPLLIPTYVTYHLLFKESDFVPQKPKEKNKHNPEKSRNYSLK